MKTYNFKTFENGNGVEILMVIDDNNKKILSLELLEIEECSKSEMISEYINFEACIKGEEAENLYNQMLNFYNTIKK